MTPIPRRNGYSVATLDLSIASLIPQISRRPVCPARVENSRYLSF
jgi:hypothetical protein